MSRFDPEVLPDPSLLNPDEALEPDEIDAPLPSQSPTLDYQTAPASEMQFVTEINGRYYTDAELRSSRRVQTAMGIARRIVFSVGLAFLAFGAGDALHERDGAGFMAIGGVLIGLTVPVRFGRSN